MALASVLSSFAAVEGVRYLQNKYLGIWVSKIEDSSSDPSVNTQNDAMIYLYYSLGCLGMVMVRVTVLSLSAQLGARTIHDSMIIRVMRAPMAFFERTPMGRVLNRFSADVETLDQVRYPL